MNTENHKVIMIAFSLLSHVDMACNVLLVIVKKVSGAVSKAQTGKQLTTDSPKQLSSMKYVRYQ